MCRQRMITVTSVTHSSLFRKCELLQDSLLQITRKRPTRGRTFLQGTLSLRQAHPGSIRCAPLITEMKVLGTRTHHGMECERSFNMYCCPQGCLAKFLSPLRPSFLWDKNSTSLIGLSEEVDVIKYLALCLAQCRRSINIECCFYMVTF